MIKKLYTLLILATLSAPLLAQSVGSESAGGAAQEKDIKTRRKNPVRTGDDSEPLVLLILLLGSGAITLCIRCFKGGNES